MTQQTATVDSATKIKDLEEENELLLLQLHQVQEELEVYFLKCKDLEAGRGGSAQASAGVNIVWVDDELPEALAEVERLKTLVSVQAEIKDIEDRNALNVKLGNMLIEASHSVGRVSTLPLKLIQFWRKATKQKPTSVLGGETYAAVIKSYEDKGFAGVESLLNLSVAPRIQGDAYTSLARHIKSSDVKAAAEAADKAYRADPKPYRLKWLAFRVYEAGDSQRAEAILALLPKEMRFSDSEKNEITQVRYDAKNERKREACRKSYAKNDQRNVSNVIKELSEKINKLSKENEKLVKEREHEVGTLKGKLRKIQEKHKFDFFDRRKSVVKT